VAVKHISQIMIDLLFIVSMHTLPVFHESLSTNWFKLYLSWFVWLGKCESLNSSSSCSVSRCLTHYR